MANKKSVKNYDETKVLRSTIKNDFKFNIGEVVINLGSLYEDYKNKECKVISQIFSKGFNYYKVEFEDGKVMELKESWMKKKENIESEDIIDEL